MLTKETTPSLNPNLIATFIMALDVLTSVEIIEIMENYMDKIRPEPDFRKHLDFGYELEDQSVILFEIRPIWVRPNEFQNCNYAKATFVKTQNCWKIFWMRSTLKWQTYAPHPTAKQLSEFLKIVDEDVHHCFKG